MQGYGIDQYANPYSPVGPMNPMNPLNPSNEYSPLNSRNGGGCMIVLLLPIGGLLAGVLL